MRYQNMPKLERIGETMTNKYGTFTIVEYNSSIDIVVKRDDDTLIHTTYKSFRQKEVKGKNRYKLFDTYGICYTLNTNDEILFDIEFYDKIKDYTWYVEINKNGYKTPRATINGKTINMQNFIFDTKNLDHINNNPLDNRRCNLRPSIDKDGYNYNGLNKKKQKNNTSGHKGVCHKSVGARGKEWIAYVEFQGKRITKRFDIFEDACNWVDEQRKILHKNFANNG